ncbi:hypothetical protein QR98_0097270, partial [Sarcoptes scabiei]
AFCTAYEYHLLHRTHDDQQQSIRKGSYDRYLLTFSAISNTKSLISNTECDHLCAVNIITLGFVTIELIGRSYVLPIFFGMINIKRPLNGLPNEYFTAKKFFFIRGSSFAVATYTLCSAVVLAYNLCAHKSQLEKSVKNYLKYCLNRYISFARRLIGPIILILLLPLIGDGPIWPYFDQLYTKPCRNSLLSTFLFLNNYSQSLDDVCLQPSVIISALFYLSLTAPIILHFYNHKIYGTIVLAVLILIGSVVSLIPKVLFNLPVMPYEIISSTSVAQSKLAFIHYYGATDQLIVVFVVGLFVGFLIRCKPKINFGKRASQFALWIGMLSIIGVSTSWNERFKPLEGNFSQFSFISWFVLSKIMWSFGFGFILFACSTGRAKPITEMMNLSFIRPLGRLSMGVFLNHITVLSLRQLTKKEVTPLNHFEILTDDIADLVIAFIISYVFYIMFERPIYHWTKIALKLDVTLSSEKRFSSCDLENCKTIDKEGIDMKPLNEKSRL